MTEPDGWPKIQTLIALAFHDDTDVANLACMELIERIDLPAIPLVRNGLCKVIRRESTTWVVYARWPAKESAS